MATTKNIPDIFLMDHYKYLAVYVDYLLIASKDPQAIIDALTGDPVSFKLKGTCPVKFHLDANTTVTKTGPCA
jgi:hypothetical protein